MINLLYHLIAIKYLEDVEQKHKQLFDGFRSGLSDCLIIVLIIVWFLKGV